jgi:hypothetical protein
LLLEFHVKRFLRLALVTVLGCALASLAHAQAKARTMICVGTSSSTLTWQPPVQNSDGSTLTDLAGFTIRFGTSSATLDQVIRLSDPKLTSYTVDCLTPGQWFFAMTSVNAASAESVATDAVSAPVVGTPPPPPILPQPPGGLKVSVPATTNTVYSNLKQTDRAVMLPVGTVPAGTTCLTGEAILANGQQYNAVPHSAVSWSGSVRPAIVYARCTG